MTFQQAEIFKMILLTY